MEQTPLLTLVLALKQKQTTRGGGGGGGGSSTTVHHASSEFSAVTDSLAQGFIELFAPGG